MQARRLRRGLVTLASLSSLALMLTLFAPQALASPSQGALTSGHHCVMQVAHVQPGEVDSRVLHYECYATFPEAIAAATGGRVQLASTARPRDLTQAILNGSASPLTSSSANPLAPRPYCTGCSVIAVENWDAHNTGVTFTVTTTGSRCFATYPNWDYSISYTQLNNAGWNDAISSALNYDFCYRGQHYENAGWSGAEVNCSSCDYIGNAMNDRTSSIRYMNG
jgi:hypothetical protein